MNYRHLFLARGSLICWLTVSLLTGCSDEMHVFRTDDGDNGLRLELQATIDQSCDTRADESGFADGDRFGLFVVNYSDGQPSALTLSGNQVNNVAMTYNSDANQWQSATDIYWRDPITPADVYGYYPFFNGLSDVNAYSFEVLADQSVNAEGEMGAYEASDFLWAKTTKASPGKKVELTFSHVMAGVKVILEQGSGFEGDAWTKLEKTVTVDNTIRNSEIDLSTGVVTPVGSFDRNIVMNPEGDAWRAVVVPQTVAAGKSTIGITIDGKPYVYTRADGMKYTAGKLHIFTIKIDRKGDGGDYSLTLVDEAITPWEADQSSHDFESNSYLTVHVADAGTLKACLEAMHVDAGSIRNLKVTGHLTDDDFRFMREEMSQLTAINLKEVKLKNVYYRVVDKNGTLADEGYVDDKMPDNAFLQSHSLRRIILPETLSQIGSYCFAYTTLSSTIVIPESVRIIEGGAFVETHGMFTIVLPNKIERIEESAFAFSSVSIDLNLPNTLKYIGDRAFSQSPEISGSLSLPSELEFLGEEAFAWCGRNLEGEIVIPRKITTIPRWLYRSVGTKNPIELTFHDGVTKIGEYAFTELSFSNPIVFPKNLSSIGNFAFSGCRFVGDIILPEGLSDIGIQAFSYSNIKGTIELPKSLEVLTSGPDGNSSWIFPGPFSNTGVDELIIGDGVEAIFAKASENCPIRTLKIGKNVEFIDEYAFQGCSSIETIVCTAQIPPRLNVTAFKDVDFSHCVVEVPENSVEAYRNAEGWSMFRSITGHHELNISISTFSCLNNGIVRNLILRAEGPWEIESKPTWVRVTPENADYKEEISVKVDPLSPGSGNREGKVVFRLKESGYTNYLTIKQYDYEYEEDKEIVLQTASGNGNAIPIFIVGEGYGAESIVTGEYLNRVNQTIEDLFSIEPYKTYRNMFNIGAAVTVSPDDGAPDVLSSKESKFGFVFPSIDCPMVSDLTEQLKNYIKTISSRIDDSNIDKTLIILLSNYEACSGSAYWCNDNCIVSCVGKSVNDYPYDNRGLVQFVVGGAFGGLASEQIKHFDNVRGCSCVACNPLRNYQKFKMLGLNENVSLSSKIEDAPWKEFMFHPKYSAFVDMYEGGLDHLGVWRSESESVMSSYIPYYNTISRYAIYKQIMKKAGLVPTLEDFIKNDKIEIPQL